MAKFAGQLVGGLLQGMLGLAVTVIISNRIAPAEDAKPAAAGLKIEWKDNYLTVRGDFPGGEVKTHYLEAYCRSGSTDRDWKETIIPHKAELLSAGGDGRWLKIKDTLRDGVVVEHEITAGADAVDFRLTTTNPTQQASQAHWAQPCMRVDKFTGCSNDDIRAIQPKYIHQCFFFVDGKLTRLPTEPWADQARYVYGQVYCPKGVDRNDVNPRPLSKLVPSNGLCGCFSADQHSVLAVGWEPCQEIFQGVIACMHSDFRLGGLQPGETKKIHGTIYIVPADIDQLLARFEREFPPAGAAK